MKLLLLASLLAITSFAQTVGIKVLAAVYGGNCDNGGIDQTAVLMEECNAKDECEVDIETSEIGDPCVGIGKEYYVSYLCIGGKDVKNIHVEGEASGKTVTLDCTEETETLQLLAYWDIGDCGAWGNDANMQQICHSDAGNCPPYVDQGLAQCTGGIFRHDDFTMNENPSRCGDYIYYNEYKCLRPKTEIVTKAYWDYKGRGPEGNDYNADKLCGGIHSGDCKQSISAKQCPTGYASISLQLGRKGKGATEINYKGVWYGWYVEYTCDVEPAPTKAIGYWTAESVERWSMSRDYIITKTYHSSTSDEASQTDMEAWSKSITQTHSAEVAVEGTFPTGAASASSAYGYTNEQAKSESFERELQTVMAETFAQELTVQQQFTVPAQEQGEPIYSNIWTFVTMIVNPNNPTGECDYAQHEMISGIQTQGCGYHLPPNCLPGFCSAYDPNCWTCTESFAIIDTNFVPPAECGGQQEGCYWEAIDSDECPSVSDILLLPTCSGSMSVNMLCESDSILPNGNTAYNVNNCGSYDVFQFVCDEVDVASTTALFFYLEALPPNVVLMLALVGIFSALQLVYFMTKSKSDFQVVPDLEKGDA